MTAAAPFDMEQHVARLSNVPSFNVWQIGPADKIEPWKEFTGDLLVQDLVIHESALANDVGSVSVQIAHWGILEARAKRIWEVVERRYRMWRDGMVMKMSTAPTGDDKWKRPPEYLIEASYRTHKEYGVWQQALERAEEAYNCARVVREAFQAKRDMLRVSVTRAYDSSGPRLSV